MREKKQSDLVTRAKKRGIRLAGPRTRVMTVIDSFARPFSAGQLLRAVERQAPSVGRATVFRTLQLLCELSLIERVRREDGQDVYVTGHASTHHHHLICTVCDDIQETVGCNVRTFVDQLARKHGFIARDHIFDIYGVCASCRHTD